MRAVELRAYCNICPETFVDQRGLFTHVLATNHQVMALFSSKDPIMTEFSWSLPSALWQLEHGEPDTERTDSAREYLRVQAEETAASNEEMQ